jgi:hypothetical protein
MDLSYPIGRFDFGKPVAAEARPQLIAEIEAAPARFREAVRGLADEQLDTPYRPGGWTVRQVVHHVADSHMNSYLRFRLALTEEEPAVKGYDQTKWAEMRDVRNGPVEMSLALLDGLHVRWVALLKSMTDADFERRFRHSEIGLVRLDTNLALYAWHGRHHAAHITGLRERMGW